MASSRLARSRLALPASLVEFHGSGRGARPGGSYGFDGNRHTLRRRAHPSHSEDSIHDPNHTRRGPADDGCRRDGGDGSFRPSNTGGRLAGRSRRQGDAGSARETPTQPSRT